MLMGANAAGQTCDMTVHLKTGQTVVIPHDDIQLGPERLLRRRKAVCAGATLTTS
jgi:hypothetical protein